MEFSAKRTDLLRELQLFQGIIERKKSDKFSNFEARKIESFSITATVTERQGVPDLLNSQQNREGDLIIPTIYDLRIDVGDPIGPMNAGSDTILRVEVTNTGNVQDKVGDVQVSDDCPLLTTDNGLDALMVVHADNKN